jgi:glycosyltransferase involved in cell wall biosynthesis
MFKPCILIPVYNHEDAMPQVLGSLKGQGLPCLMIDDGSSDKCKAVLEALAGSEKGWVSLIRIEPNQGKGAAVMAGCRVALARGFSHVLQIDADGQHEAGDLPRFLAAARQKPAAVICGHPVFDRSVPRSRLYGRLITTFWIHVNTLSTDIKDAMCGLRVYPLASIVALMDRVKLGRRMDFDPELLVRLSWQGLSIVNLPTRVHYPADGRSHFKMGLDNWLISRMHARLFFGMLARFPLLLWNKWQAHAKADGPKSPSSALPGA